MWLQAYKACNMACQGLSALRLNTKPGLSNPTAAARWYSDASQRAPASSKLRTQVGSTRQFVPEISLRRAGKGSPASSRRRPKYSSA
jgi:hypothetical protein